MTLESAIALHRWLGGKLKDLERVKAMLVAETPQGADANVVEQTDAPKES
jgi:hypothetical protein